MKNFKYFLECYLSVDFDAKLEEIIDEFIESEDKMYSNMLLKELNEINNNQQWDDAKEFIRKYGNRNISEDEVKHTIQLLLKKLSVRDKNEDVGFNK